MIAAACALHAAAVAGLALYVGHAGAARVGLERGALRRWAAACVIAPATLIAIFHVLASFGAFTPVGATLALAAVAGGLALGRRPRGDAPVAALLEADRGRLARLARPLSRGPQRPLSLALVALASLGVGRAMAYPPLAWDALTYHAVKPVLWLQSGGALGLDAPGGWSTHAGRLAGADVVGAWAMLAGPGDLAWGAADVFWWGALAVGLALLSAEVGLRVRERLAVVAYGGLVPTTFLSVGSGYAELPVAATTCLGLALLLDARRHRHAGAALVALVAAASLAAMKLVAWPAAGVLALGSLGSLATRKPKERPTPLAAAVLGGVALVVALAGPARNWIETGYPLSVPVTIGGIALGPPNAAIAWLERTARAAHAGGLSAELEALSWAFGDPARSDPQLTWLALPVLALALVGIGRALRRGGGARAHSPNDAAAARSTGGGARAQAAWTLAVALAVLGAWLSPPLEVVRLEWARTNPRHLLAAVLPMLPYAFVAVRGHRAASTLLGVALASLGALHAAWNVVRRWPDLTYHWAIAPAGLVLLAFVLWPMIDATRRRRAGAPALGPIAFAAIALAVVAGLAAVGFRDFPSTQRARRFAARSAFDAPPKYWLEAAFEVDRPGRPFTVAITSGPEPAADAWLAYPFFGSAHQNRLVYVPVTDAPGWLPLVPGSGRAERARFDLWWRRLGERDVDWVMAFAPRALELGWMESRPARFVRTHGDGRSFGLYRVRRAEAPPP